ncbi:ImmA/IrrE family metallo-endopeptidase [Cohnella sp. GCM10027633]|uniref:ImmA/IrrE family metallo-endopeptidase n=1 Tax=unclassified Cohnella TaxID=2636738 RepID=UPI0036405F99
MHYESLLQEARHRKVDVHEVPLLPATKGLYADQTVWINRSLPTTDEKACILAEELGHYYTSTGNILDQSDVRNRKQERRARQWAHERLVPLGRIVDAYHARVKGQHEIAEFLGVTEPFLQSALDRYKDRYGLCAFVGTRYIVIFEPLSVAELFEPR